MMPELDSLLNGYVSRKQGERDQAEQKRLRDAERKANAVRIITAIALPVLRQFSDELAQKGFRAEVRERFDSIEPGIELAFTPSQSDPQRYSSSQSTLGIRLHEIGKLCVSRHITQQDSGKIPGYNAGDFWEMSEVSEAKVRQAALDFVEAVLRFN